MRGLIIAGGLLLGLLSMGCSASTPATPAPSRLLFSTPTPPAVGAALLPSAALTATLEATEPLSPMATPTSAPAPAITPTLTLEPMATPAAILTSTFTPAPTATPHAVINSPGGFLNVRPGPGRIYEPPLGAYDNGATVGVMGKQYSPEGELWWLIPFIAGSPTGQGWIYAGYTRAQNIDYVPWVAAPPPPTPLPSPPPVVPSLTPGMAPVAVINSPTGFSYVRSGPGSSYEPPLGVYNNGMIVPILGQQDGLDGQLWWLVPFGESPEGQGWIFAAETITQNGGDVPCHYNFPALELTRQAAPDSCTYESVISLTQGDATARLQSLGFTVIQTRPIEVAGKQDLIGRVLIQEPNPLAEGQPRSVNCTMPVMLGIGAEAETQ